MKYLAFTIGPIYTTTQKAQSTRGLWGASYLFSFLMKSIIEKFKAKRKFIIPLTADVRIFEAQKGAGLFPDRFIFEAQSGDVQLLETAINGVLDDFCGKIEAPIRKQMSIELKDKKLKSIPVFSKTDLIEYFNQYLLLVAIEKEINTGNIIDECNRVLSILELQQPIQPPTEIDYLHFLLQGINQQSHLLEDGFGSKTARLPSIIEISSGQLGLINKPEYDKSVNEMLRDNELDDDDFVKKLKIEFKDHFKRRHKYIAIVTADGDNMGKTVEQIYNKAPTKINEVDQLLLDFNIETVGLIDKYGGKSVYLGGDDLLFFTPVSYEDNQTVFKLVEDISEKYNQKFKAFFEKFKKTDQNFWEYEDEKTGKKEVVSPPTLSFGVSISYYKYPMFEAVEAANRLLHQAKEGEKNAVAFRVLKHSGQYFGAIITKKDDTYKKFFVPILELSINDDAFLSSIQFQLNSTKHVVEAVLETTLEKNLKNYFDNFFNEPVHGIKEQFLGKVQKFLWQTFRDTQDAEISLQTVYSTLRTFQFLNQNDIQDEQ